MPARASGRCAADVGAADGENGKIVPSPHQDPRPPADITLDPRALGRIVEEVLPTKARHPSFIIKPRWTLSTTTAT